MRRKNGNNKHKRIARRRIVESLEDRRVLTGLPVISEILASNDRSIDDLDGDDSDYVELFNAGDSSVSLNRYFLTDDPEDLQKWRFPDVELGVGKYLVVFASSKDRNDPQGELHTNFRLSANGEFLALVEPDGKTIASQFETGFPQQLTDISYGVPTGIESSVLLSSTATGKLLVPTDNTLDPTEPDVVTGTWLAPDFDDSGWTSASVGVGYRTESSMVVFADSVAEFSGVQGQDQWTYGSWTENLDSDMTYAAEEFVPIRVFDETMSKWDGGLNGNPPNTEITDSGGHPTVGFLTQWAIRRWTSETTGDVTISGTLGNLDAAGDGIVGRILINGSEVYQQAVSGESVDYRVTTSVQLGDHIDFAIDAGPAGDDVGDQSTFTSMIRGEQLRRPPVVLLTNSDDDFARSEVQGIGNNWFYGYYDRFADADASYQADDFQPFDAEQWSQTRWVKSEIQIRGNAQQSYADESTNQWAVRRWLSDTSGSLVVEYDYSMSARGGTGTTGRLFHNGVEVDMVTVAGGDRTGQTRSVTLSGVNQGDTIDLLVDPTGPNDDPTAVPDGEDDRAGVEIRISRLADVSESINTDIGDRMRGVNSSAYLRVPFEVGDVRNLDDIHLNVKYDDGFVAYVNGRRVADSNAPLAPAFDSAALTERPPEESTLVESFDISDHRGVFQSGRNVLQIHVLSATSNADEVLMQPEITIGTVVTDLDENRFFGIPTPGAANGIGADRVGPQIIESSHTPRIPTSGEAILVSATVTETFDDLRNVQLSYHAMYGETVTVPMLDDGQNGDLVAGDGTFVASIPAGLAQPGEMIRWHVMAFDANGLQGRYPPFSNPSKDEDFSGTMVADDSATSNLPIFHTFIEDFSAAATSRGTRGALYYNGELYSNVEFNLHGQSSSGFPTPKKSLNVDFPNDHRFLLEDDMPRMDDINLLTNFADQSKLRNTLAYEQRAMTGGGYHLAFPVHFRNNAEFFGVYDFVEDAGSEWLERLGLDPNNSLYKVYDALGSVSNAEKKTRQDEGKDDLSEFIQGVRLRDGADVDYIMDHVNLAQMANFLAGFDITSNLDCCHKNYYAYQDTSGTGEWWYFIWDVDLSNGRNWGGFGRAYFDETIYHQNPLRIGTNNLLIGKLFNSVPGFDEMYLRRVRTLMDEYIKPPGTPRDELPLETRVDELVELLRTDADLDNALHADDSVWQSPYQSFEQGVQELLDLYATQRRDWLYNSKVISDQPEVRDIISPEPGAATGSFFIPTDDSLGTSWTALDFDDSQWRTGPLGIGAEPEADHFDEVIATDLGEELLGKTSLYVRVPFRVDDPAALTGISLRMKYEDGFVAYINGVEVHRENLAQDESPTFETRSRNRSRDDALVLQDINISDHIELIRPGDNVLAIHSLNNRDSSPEMFVLPGLVDGVLTSVQAEIPRAQVGNPMIEITTVEFNPTSGNQQEEYVVVTNNNEVSVDISNWTLSGDIRHTFDPGTVLIAGGSLYVTPDARAFRARGEGPSGGQRLFVQGNYDGRLPNVGGVVQLVAADGELVTEVNYVGEVSAVQQHLRISEIMYNPLSASTIELASDASLISEDFEFVEVTNTSADITLDLTGVHFGDGVQFSFTDSQVTQLGPGERAVIASNADAFRLRYGDEALLRVAGTFTANTSLRDTGEQLTLLSGDGSLVQDFVYRDTVHEGWPLLADGHGSSLIPIDLSGDFSEPTNWRSSREIGGAPGSPTINPEPGVVINEVLSRSVAPTVDSIELFNPTANPISLANHYLSDSSANLDSLQKFSLGDRSIPAGGYLVLTESDFNAGGGQNANDFALNGDGDQLFLTRIGGDGNPQIIDGVVLDAAVPDESYGRSPDGVGPLYPNVSQTFGSQNSGPRVGPIVITEIAYAPPEPSAAALAIDAALDSSDLEFVEVFNPTAEAVDLTNWRIRLGINLNFDVGTQIAPGQSLVVIPFNPNNAANASRLDAFRAHYGLNESTVLVGGYAGQLSGRGEGVRLQRAVVDPLDPTLIRRYLEDEVAYDDQSPWQSAEGQSLHRVSATAFGHNPINWIAAAPTPGVFGDGGLIGDLNMDGAVDLQDVEALHAAGIANDGTFDLTGDSIVDQEDIVFLVENLMGSHIGDVNGDRIFNSSDLVQLFALGGFEDDTAGNATYVGGDWNLDGDFTTTDFVLAFARGGYVSEAEAGLRAATNRDTPRSVNRDRTANRIDLHVLELDLLFEDLGRSLLAPNIPDAEPNELDSGDSRLSRWR